MNLLRLSIRQTYAQLGLDTIPARLDLKQPKGEQTIRQQPAELDFEQPRGVLEVDSSAAWDALGKGESGRFFKRLYGQMNAVGWDAIATIVEKGNRLAQIADGSNGIAELAANNKIDFAPIEYLGEASFLNVKLRYTMQAPQTNIEPRKAETQYTPQRVQSEYQRGKVQFHMEQLYHIDIRVSDYVWVEP